MRAAVRIADPDDARAATLLLGQRGYEVVDPGPATSPPIDLLVVDEWTPESAPWVQEARESGTPTAVLAELLLDDAAGSVVGVTGTAGKTSTCRALAHLLRATGAPVRMSDAARSGNAWPDHSLAGDMPPDAVVVAELTSTHLCHMGSVRVDVGVVTTVRPDHIELHGSLERYFAAKRRLVHAVPPGGPVVLPVDDTTTLAALGVHGQPKWGFGYDTGAGHGAFLSAKQRVLLRSPQGREEAPCPARGTGARAVLAASATALALGVPVDAVAGSLARLPQPPHRMAARVLETGITLIDNTMAATPLKVLAGIDDAPAGQLVVVVGGNRAPSGTPVHDSPDERRALVEALRQVRERASLMVAFGPAAADVRDVVAVDREAPDIRSALDLALRGCPVEATVMVAPMFPMTPAERNLVAGYSPAA